MTHLPTILLFIIISSSTTSTTTINTPHLCSTFPNLSSLASDRLTVLISSFHPSRSVLLPNLTLLYSSLPFISSVILHSSRFVLVSDDDIKRHPPSPSLATRHPLSLLGFFARSHFLSLPSKSWIYTVHPDRYSILLTKLMVLRADHLHNYTCWGGLSRARAVVERERNCEDILMNFVGAMVSGEGRCSSRGG